jgi:hypothetical protein
MIQEIIAHDIGTSLGTTSKGTHGKTPLPNIKK